MWWCTRPVEWKQQEVYLKRRKEIYCVVQKWEISNMLVMSRTRLSDPIHTRASQIRTTYCCESCHPTTSSFLQRQYERLIINDTTFHSNILTCRTCLTLLYVCLPEIRYSIITANNSSSPFIKNLNIDLYILLTHIILPLPAKDTM